MFVDKGIEPVEVFCKVCLFPRLRVIFKFLLGAGGGGGGVVGGGGGGSGTVVRTGDLHHCGDSGLDSCSLNSIHFGQAVRIMAVVIKYSRFWQTL